MFLTFQVLVNFFPAATTVLSGMVTSDRNAERLQVLYAVVGEAWVGMDCWVAVGTLSSVGVGVAEGSIVGTA